MKFSKKILSIPVLLAVLTALPAFALPPCPDTGGFGRADNLFDSLVSGVAMLRANTDCSFLEVSESAYYFLYAEDSSFSLVEHDFSSGSEKTVLNISVPEQGDYVTSDTCNDPTRESNEIRSPSRHLRVVENSDGAVTVHSGHESCSFRQCPKFGACE